MTITIEDLKNSHTKEQAHFTGQGFFGYTHTCIEYPRLSCIDKYLKSDRSVTRTWRVDGVDVKDWNEAVEKLNVPPIITLDERMALDVIPDEFEGLRAVEKTVKERFGDEEGRRLMYRLDVLGLTELGRSPDRSDGLPWDEGVPDHLRFSPTIRKRKATP